MVIRYDFVKSMNRGRLPDPPEPIECNGEFNAERCDGCSEYDECKLIAEGDDTDDP